MVTHGLIKRNAVRDLLYQSDALVLASRSEVQPLVLLEAMSTGIPVVSTACIPRNLRIEGGCTIVPVDDAAAFSEAMKQVMVQPVDGERLSQEVHRLASPEVIGQRLTDVFNAVMTSA